MSYTTWTSRAVASETVPWKGAVWRLVESQHVASTMKLVDSLDEQLVLERLLDEVEGGFPIYVGGSRFRGETDPGVFYGAEDVSTCCAEVGYWRLRFLQDAMDLTHIDPVRHTAFRVRLNTTSIDLRVGAFAVNRADWEHPDSYVATQFLSRSVREARIGCIRYRSVRDPNGGGCAAVVDPAAFERTQPEQETKQLWLSVGDRGAFWREG